MAVLCWPFIQVSPRVRAVQFNATATRKAGHEAHSTALVTQSSARASSVVQLNLRAAGAGRVRRRVDMADGTGPILTVTIPKIFERTRLPN